MSRQRIFSNSLKSNTQIKLEILQIFSIKICIINAVLFHGRRYILKSSAVKCLAHVLLVPEMPCIELPHTAKPQSYESAGTHFYFPFAGLMYNRFLHFLKPAPFHYHSQQACVAKTSAGIPHDSNLYNRLSESLSIIGNPFHLTGIYIHCAHRRSTIYRQVYHNGRQEANHCSYSANQPFKFHLTSFNRS